LPLPTACVYYVRVERDWNSVGVSVPWCRASMKM
jgi:hypothetical protein